MSSARPDTRSGDPVLGRARRAWHRNTLGLRLTLGYALLFVVSAVALFALTYALLGRFLYEQDETFLRTQLRVTAEAYDGDGLPGVRRHAASLRGDDLGEEVLIRIATAENRTLLLVPPDEWEPADLHELEAVIPNEDVRIGIVNPREDQDLEVVTRRLADGTFLQMGVSSDERDDVLESFPQVFVVIALPLMLLALFGGAFMAYRALRPIRRLTGTLDAIVGTGDVRERAPSPEAQGEFAELFHLFNRMLDRIESLVGRFRRTLDDVAHDLRTPLTRLRGSAELALQKERDPAAYREALAEVMEASDAAVATLDAIMDVAEAEAGTMPLRVEPVAVADLVEDVLDLYELVAEEKGVALTADLGAAGVVPVDRSRMRQALANLVDNAVKYTPPGGRVAVRTERSAEAVRITVEDTGIGIAAEDLPRIWDRLYRGEAGRHERGLGLGLSLVRAIVEAHGGRVEASSRPGAGATFVVTLRA